jgi:hypothetical protein
MNGASNPEIPGGSRGDAAGNANTTCEAASDAFWKLMEACGLPREATSHFRQARIEVLKGVREVIDHRIENLSRANRKGTRVAVD